MRIKGNSRKGPTEKSKIALYFWSENHAICWKEANIPKLIYIENHMFVKEK